MATANYAIHLDGVNEHWTISDDASFDYATGNNFTFGIWFWRDHDDNSTSTRSYLWSRENQHAMYIESGELVYYFNGAGGAVTWKTGVRVEKEKVHFLCLTGAESTNTTLNLYLNGKLEATKLVTGGMPADTDTNLYFGIDYDTTAGYYLKGSMTGWFQSKDTAITAANVTTAWNSGVYDIDTTEAIVGLDDSIGFEENTGTTYDNALNAGIDGGGQNTPVWVAYLDLGQKAYDKQLHLTGVGECLSRPVVVSGLYWRGDAIADGDELKITDKNDKVVFNYIATTADTGFNVEFFHLVFANGIEVATLGNGQVDLRLK